MKPLVCLVTSSESAQATNTLLKNLDDVAEIDVIMWDDEGHTTSNPSLPRLLDTLEKADFGILASSIALDNFMLPLGLLIGSLGAERCVLVTTGDATECRNLAKLLRLPPSQVRSYADSEQIKTNLEALCDEVRKRIQQCGRRQGA